MTDLFTAIDILRPELKVRRELKFELIFLLHSQTTYFSVICYDIFDIIDEYIPLLHKNYADDCFDIPTKLYAEFLAKHEIFNPFNPFELKIRASDFGETLSYAVNNYRYIKLLDSGPVINDMDGKKLYLGNNTFVHQGALIKTMDIHWFKLLPCGLIIICRTKPWSTDMSIQRAFLIDGTRYKDNNSYALPTEYHEETFMINFDTDRPRHVELDIRQLPLKIYCNDSVVHLVDDYGRSKSFPNVSQNVYKSSQYSVECLCVAIGE